MRPLSGGDNEHKFINEVTNFKRHAWTDRNELDRKQQIGVFSVAATRTEEIRGVARLRVSACVCEAGLTGHSAEVEVFSDDLLELAVHGARREAPAQVQPEVPAQRGA